MGESILIPNKNEFESKIAIFKNEGIDLLVSLALSFFAVQNPVFAGTLFSQIGNITTFFIILFFIAFVGELFGFRKRGSPEEALITQGAILFVVLSVGFLFSDQLPTLPIPGGTLPGQTLVFIVAIVFILGIFWMAFRTGEHGSPANRQPQ